VTTFRVPTKDGERLFAWLVAPLGVYAKHANEFVKEQSHGSGDIEETVNFKLLCDNPRARLLLYCEMDHHGALLIRQLTCIVVHGVSTVTNLMW
jgi:hypothetical protein